MRRHHFPRIQITIRTREGGTNTTNLIKALQTIEDAVDIALYDLLFTSLSRLDVRGEERQRAIDAYNARYRSGQRPGNLNVTNVYSGSIVLELALAAGAAWLLKSTIGESIKGGWKKSDVNEAIESAVAKGLNAFSKNVKEIFKRRAVTSGDTPGHKMLTHQEIAGDAIVIDVEFEEVSADDSKTRR